MIELKITGSSFCMAAALERMLIPIYYIQYRVRRTIISENIILVFRILPCLLLAFHQVEGQIRDLEECIAGRLWIFGLVLGVLFLIGRRQIAAI